jgi:hypothetical protein
VEEPFTFCLCIFFHIFILSSVFLFLSFLHYVFRKAFSADLRRRESEGHQGRLTSSLCVSVFSQCVDSDNTQCCWRVTSRPFVCRCEVTSRLIYFISRTDFVVKN